MIVTANLIGDLMNTSARGSKLTSMYVSPATLSKASVGWSDQQDTLNRAHKRLQDAALDMGSLGSRVTPAARAFLETWIDSLESQGNAAKWHADDLQHAAANYNATDAAANSEILALMPWDQRRMRPDS